MGIAVLPFEMHKDFIKFAWGKGESDREKKFEYLLETVTRSAEYKELLKYIKILYKEEKWC